MHTTTVPSNGSAFRADALACRGAEMDPFPTTKASATCDAAAATQRTQATDFILVGRRSRTKNEKANDVSEASVRRSRKVVGRLWRFVLLIFMLHANHQIILENFLRSNGTVRGHGRERMDKVHRRSSTIISTALRTFVFFHLVLFQALLICAYHMLEIHIINRDQKFLGLFT